MGRREGGREKVSGVRRRIQGARAPLGFIEARYAAMRAGSCLYLMYIVFSTRVL